jgi:CheY-like chemotaxis protein
MNHAAPSVLVVDDEPAIRVIVRTYLERAGMLTIGAGSGEQALEILQSGTPWIRLLITDVVMPGMSGHQLCERAREVRPALPVIFISAYSDGALEPDPCTRWLSKPLNFERLINEALELTGPLESQRAVA